MRFGRMPLSKSMALSTLVVAVFGLATCPSPSMAQPPDAVAKSSATDEERRELERQQEEEYYELIKLFADVMDQVERNYVKEVSRRELMEAAVRGVITKLDPYSNYIAPEEFDRFKSGVENEFGGIGIQVTVENGHLKIISPLVGSPAYREGLMAGDRIIKIAGQGTKGITLDEAVKKLKGKVGTKVEFTVYHPADGSTRQVALVREIVKVATVLGHMRNKDDSWDFMIDPEKKIGYIRVTAYSRNTTQELRNALKKLEENDMRALVLDLRFNPGGLLSAAIEVSDLFISSGRIVSTEGRNAPSRQWDARKDGTFEGFPMVVLVNRYSASASEIVSACLQDHDRAVVIGERTWGKGSVQNIIELEHGRSALKLTTAGYQRPSGKNIHRFPDADENDDWGVSPNKGFLIKLSPAENSALMKQQRDTFIVPAKDQGNEEPGEDETESEAAPFVDRQLKAALEHLAKELGHGGDDEVEAEDPELQEVKPA
jgi:carboxyl-terminal processing protease